MKFFCASCGIHFPKEFDTTMLPPCNFWGDLGMSNLQIELKRKFWDWLFSMPSDEIGAKANIGISVEFRTIPLIKEDWFLNRVRGYKDWTEDQQQAFQKEYFKARNAGQDMEVWLKAFDTKTEAKSAD